MSFTSKFPVFFLLGRASAPLSLYFEDETLFQSLQTFHNITNPNQSTTLGIQCLQSNSVQEISILLTKNIKEKIISYWLFAWNHCIKWLHLPVEDLNFWYHPRQKQTNVSLKKSTINGHRYRYSQKTQTYQEKGVFYVETPRKFDSARSTPPRDKKPDLCCPKDFQQIHATKEVQSLNAMAHLA